MAEDLQVLEDRVTRRYKVALLFCVPLLAGFALILLDSIWGVALLEPGMVFGLLCFGFLAAAVPVTLYGRAKNAYVREVQKSNLAAVAAVFENKS